MGDDPDVLSGATGRRPVAERMLVAVAERPPMSAPRTAQDRRIRRTWWLLSGSFFILGLITALNLVSGLAQRIDWIIAGLVVVSGLAAVLHRQAVAALEAGRRLEAESFARILQGLSRSVSPDAIVDAIVEELGVGTGADHVVVVRLRPDAQVLEATLVSQRAGVPSSTTILPLSDLDLPDGIAVAAERPPVAIPIAVDEPAVAAAPSGAAVFGAPSIGSRPATVTVAMAGGVAVAEPTTAPAVRDARLGEVVIAPPRSSRLSADSQSSGRGAPGRRATDRRVGRDRRRTWPALGAVAALRALAETDLPLDDRAVAVTSGPAVRVADRLAARVRSVYGLSHTLSAPLVTASGVIGAIVVSRRTSDGWSVAAQRILGAAAVEASAALERAYSHRAAEARAATDALTGLPNRRYFDEFCGLLARRRRADDALGVLMVDIDHFKRLNDRHGHAIGDHVLKAVARAIAAAVRDDDVPARFGGEEFAVLLRNPTRTVALEVGERIRSAVAGLDLGRLGVNGVSVSVGVAVSRAPDQPIDELLDEADRALYSAKRAGRNRVIAA